MHPNDAPAASTQHAAVLRHLRVALIITAVAAAREMDAHVLLNPETIGEFGVRYRIDWWLDGDVSFLRKLTWAAIAALAVAAATAP